MFNFLRKEEAEALGSVNSIAATYTFNGAGAGDVLHGRRLTNVIADFARLRDNASGLEIPFSDPRAAALYRELRSTAYRTPVEIAFAIAEVVRRNVAVPDSALLRSALSRMETILAEVRRLPSLSSGGERPTSPKQVDRGDIDALQLDYQLAVLISSRATAAHDAGVVSGAISAVSGCDNRSGILANAFDVYGANPPSAVANSQWDYGQEMDRRFNANDGWEIQRHIRKSARL